MPTKVYDNAWLRAREEARRFTGPGEGITTKTILKPGAEEALYGDGSDPVAAAKAFLAKPSVTQSTNVGDIEDVNKRLAWNSANQQEARRIDLQKKYGSGVLNPEPPSLRAITEPMNAVGSALSAASLPAYLLGPEVGMPMQALGGLLKTPDYMRRRLSPDEGMGEKDTSALEGLGLAADLALTGTVGRRPKLPEPPGPPSASNLRKTFGARVNEEVPYRMPGGPGVDLPKSRWWTGESNREMWNKPYVPRPATEEDLIGSLSTTFPYDRVLNPGFTGAGAPSELTATWAAPATERAGFPQIEADRILAGAKAPKRASAQALDEMLGSMQQVEPGAGPVVETPGWNANQRLLSEVPASKTAQLGRAIDQLNGDLAVAEASGNTAKAGQIRKAIRKAQMDRRIKGGG